VGVDILLRDGQQAEGIPLAEGAGLLILGIGLCLTLVTMVRASRTTKAETPGGTRTGNRRLDEGVRYWDRPSGPDGGGGTSTIEPAAVRNQNFRVILRGYDRREVDALLEKVAVAVAAGRHPEALVRQATFRQRLTGYHRGDVDQFLDLLVASWRPLGLPPPPPPKPLGTRQPTGPFQPGQPLTSQVPADRPTGTRNVFTQRTVQASLVVAVLGAAVFGVTFIGARSGPISESSRALAATNCPLALDEWTAIVALTPGDPGASRALGPDSPELAWVDRSAKQLKVSTMVAQEPGVFRRAESECIHLWSQGRHLRTMPLPPQPNS
jgi:DivIVA domain-containing protein